MFRLASSAGSQMRNGERSGHRWFTRSPDPAHGIGAFRYSIRNGFPHPRPTLCFTFVPTRDKIKYGDGHRRGIHDPIVSDHLFEQVREKIDLRRTRKPGRQPTQFSWPLSGWLTCGICGHKMSTHTNRHGIVTYLYYRCRSEVGGNEPCREANISAYEMERFVWSQLDDAEQFAGTGKEETL